MATVERLNQVIVEQIKSDACGTCFRNSKMTLRVLFCPDCVMSAVPVQDYQFHSLTHSDTEKVSRTFLYKVHLKI